VLPFLSQRYASRAAEVVSGTPAQDTARYDQKVRDILATLCAGFTSDAVNIVMAHLTVTGGKMGGGERDAQSIFEYHVPAAAFPAAAHYVALGHLHRRQHIPAPCPVHYCGSPINVDFGEQDNQSYALLVEATPSTPASITELPITSAVQLRTVKGTVAQLRENAASYGEALLRVTVDEPTRSGLREEIQQFLPNALEIRIAPEHQVAAGGGAAKDSLLDKSPAEILDTYLTEQNVNDARLPNLFRFLHDGVEEGGAGDVLSSGVVQPPDDGDGASAPATEAGLTKTVA
jgi:exonuclease SbcD